MKISRRSAIRRFGIAVGGTVVVPRLSFAQSPAFRLAHSADVTVPVGHGMMGGAWLSKSVADPLFANGIVLMGGRAGRFCRGGLVRDSE